MLAERALLLEAGYPTFTRGLDYAQSGLVSAVRFSGGVLTARVRGARRYKVQVDLGDEPSFSCTCEVGEEDVICQHSVAAVLAWIGVDAR